LIRLRPQKQSRFSHLPLLLLVVVLLAGSLVSVQAQERQELVEKRERLIAEIKQTEEELKTTKQNRENALERYLTLQSQVRKRQLLINTLGEEITYIDQSVERTQLVIQALDQDVERLEAEFANIVRTAYRQKLNSSRLAFLLSADSFNDALQRWRYLKQYEAYREKQARLILETRETLVDKINTLEQRKIEKQDLLASERSQKKQLDQELKDRNALLKDLTSSEEKLVQELEKQRKQQEKLDSAIEAIIFAEADKNRAEARTSAALPDNSAASVENVAELSGEFERWRGKLPWPVQSGTVARSFGEQPHPRFQNLTVNNNGIDISTESSPNVYAVFEGRVAGTQFIPGYQNMVIIQHGNYYTVYSQLETVNVKRNDQIRAGQVIGKLSNQKQELHFEVWKEKKRLNPAYWISRT